MEYAIGVGVGSRNGFKEIRVLSCTDEQYRGSSWFAFNPDGVREGNYYNVKFDPQDQFCHVITLGNIQDRGI